MLDMNVFIAANALAGNLVYYMSQSSTPPLSEPGPWGTIKGGYCAGLAVRWIRLAYEEKDFPSESGWTVGGASVRVFNGSDWQATMYQNKLGQYSTATGADMNAQAAYALGLAQMIVAPGLRESGPKRVNGQRLARILKQSYGCYYVALYGSQSAHAIAMRHAPPPNGTGPGVLHIFDANYGHFAWQARASDWAGLIDAYLYFSEYGFYFPMGYFIGKANRPIY